MNKDYINMRTSGCVVVHRGSTYQHNWEPDHAILILLKAVVSIFKHKLLPHTPHTHHAHSPPLRFKEIKRKIQTLLSVPPQLQNNGASGQIFNVCACVFSTELICPQAVERWRTVCRFYAVWYSVICAWKFGAY